MQPRDVHQAHVLDARSAFEGVVKMPRKPKTPQTVVEAVTADLKALPEHLAGSGPALTALSLARDMDDSETSATARAAGAKVLLGAMRELRELAPAREELDELDELKARRDAV